MKERPILFSAPMVRAILAGTKTQTRRVVKGCKDPDFGCQMAPGEIAGDEHKARLCPYGQPGDRLWVREAWARTTVGLGTEMVVYREGDNRTDYGGPWKPGIHMFRRDSRITLELTAVRVERLQGISHDDACAEGIHSTRGGEHACIERFRVLWESINGPGSWDANPWVWVVQFKRVDA